jgi:hypothetical protein
MTACLRIGPPPEPELPRPTAQDVTRPARMAGGHSAGGLILTAALAGLLVAACARPEPRPGPWRRVPAPPSAPAGVVVEPTWCSGGQLCESRRPLGVWRVPAACGGRSRRSHLELCRMPALPWPQVQEFFETRYGRVVVEGPGLSVRGLSPAAHFPPRPATEVAEADASEPSLYVRVGPGGIEVLAPLASGRGSTEPR